MAEEFTYVSAVEGHLVSRFGTKTYIGAELVAPGQIEWSPNEIFVIPLDEWNRSSKEYARAVTHGALVVHTKEKYDAWVKERTARMDAAMTELTTIANGGTPEAPTVEAPAADAGAAANPEPAQTDERGGKRKGAK